MIWSVDEKPPACPLVDAIGVRYSLARSRRTPASDLDSVMIIGGSPLHGSTRPAGRQLIGFGGEARRDEAAREGTHAEINRIGAGMIATSASQSSRFLLGFALPLQ